jgi:hypothetical protein
MPDPIELYLKEILDAGQSLESFFTNLSASSVYSAIAILSAAVLCMLLW